MGRLLQGIRTKHRHSIGQRHLVQHHHLACRLSRHDFVVRGCCGHVGHVAVRRGSGRIIARCRSRCLSGGGGRHKVRRRQVESRKVLSRHEHRRLRRTGGVLVLEARLGNSRRHGVVQVSGLYRRSLWPNRRMVRWLWLWSLAGSRSLAIHRALRVVGCIVAPICRWKAAPIGSGRGS